MTKTYCDKCNEPIDKSGTGNNPDQEGEVNIGSGLFLFRIDTSAKLKPGITVSYNRDEEPRNPEDIHICLHCRLAALNALDKRPQVADLASAKIAEIRDKINSHAFGDVRDVLDCLNS